MNTNNVSSFYDIKLNDIRGQAIDLRQFAGKKILIVNVASECGYTPQYEQLQELYDAHKSSLVIMGCPSNDFGGQEPGTSEEILTFCKKNYGVTFTLTEKVGIKSNRHQLYDWLCTKEKNGKADYEVKWNFHKFVLDGNGTVIGSFPSSVSPIDEQITDLIQ
jgi:glutathione peroxidase